MIDLHTFTDAGPRTQNEDSVLAANLPNGRALLAVADGLGGHFGGKEASGVAIEVIQQKVLEDVGLKETFEAVHSEIIATQILRPDLRGMATTATAVLIDNFALNGAHCGDTRCMLQRGSGIMRLTVEHTEAQRLLKAGRLTKSQFLRYPRRNVLDSALGSDSPPDIDTFKFDLLKGDKILITSDGVHEKIRAREVLEIVERASSSKEIVELIRDRVISQGPDDNFSIAAAVI